MATEMLQYLDPDGLDETVLNIGQIKTNLEEEMQELPYARPDGIYPDMTVGAVIGADSTAQWAQRESTGSGGATVRSVQGAAIGYNQYQVDSYTISAYGLTTTVENGLLTITGTPSATTTAAFALMAGTGLQIPSGHKLLLYNTNNTLLMYVQGLSAHANTGHRFLTADDDTYGKLAVSIPITEGQPVNISAHVMLFDLTQMFGSGNEPSTVAEFEAMHPEPYYPYSAPTLKPVQIAGIRSTDAQGGELDSVEWDTFTLRGAGSIGDMLYSDRKETKVGVVDLGTLAWARAAETSGHPYFYSSFYGLPAPAVQPAASLPNATCAIYQRATFADLYNNYANIPDGSIGLTNGSAGNNSVYIKDDEVTDVTALRAKLSGVLLFYELATPTTTPISPALPMTYKVQQGGSESIIVPDGEISAAPVLTIAEPVNMSTELTRIWEAIQSLGYTQNTAQLSRPVSLTDIGSIDEVQKDTADVVEIDTTKEVTE